MTPAEFKAAIPLELRNLRRWCAWGPDPESKRPKCPLLISNRARRASTRKPTTWFDFSTAFSFWQKYGQITDRGPSEYGIGFVFTAGAPDLVYIDLDDAVDGDGNLRAWAEPFVVPFFNKAYIELSPSGHGLHVIARGKLPVEACGGKVNFLEHQSVWALGAKKVPEVAMFAAGKFTTISGDVIDPGRKMADDCTAEIAQVWARAGIRATGVDKVAGPAPDERHLVKVDMRKVPKPVRDELKDCTAEDADDRSAARFKLYADAAEKLEAEEIFSLVVLHEDWYQRSGAAEKGYEATWLDVVRCCAKAETAAKEFAEAQEEAEEEQEKRLVAWKDLGLPIVERVTKAGVETRVAYGVQAMKLVLLRHPDWKGRIRRNTMTQQVELDGRILTESLSDVAEALRSYLGWESEPHLNLVQQAVLETAEAQAHNPVADWLRTLKWDGAVRIDDWLVRAGCEDVETTRLIGRKWIISLVARALRPGCKVDTVLILEGFQGKKKSTLLEVLAGEALFTDSSVAFERDDKLVMHKHWIVELSELSSFKKAEVETVKNFLSRRKDDFRAPYGRAVQSYPRHFVIVGSTNTDQYLEDSTGNRRYWPVRVNKLDPEAVKLEREQLLAEAVVALEAGEPWWFEEDPEALREAQEARVVSDALEVAVDAAIRDITESDPNVEFTLGSLMQLMGYSLERKDLQSRVSIILRQKRFTRVLRRKPAGWAGNPAPWRGWLWRSFVGLPERENAQEAEIIQLDSGSRVVGGEVVPGVMPAANPSELHNKSSEDLEDLIGSEI